VYDLCNVGVLLVSATPVPFLSLCAKPPHLLLEIPVTSLGKNGKIFLSPTIPTIYQLFLSLKNGLCVQSTFPLAVFCGQKEPIRRAVYSPAGFSISLSKDQLHMNRKERRAAAHKDRKLARKAGFPAPQPKSEPVPVAPVVVPETQKPANPISAAQLTANRANAQLSTGPKTEIGRAVSSQNRTTHRLARHNRTFILLSTEDPDGFEALKALLAAEHQPSTETESILINSMAESHWLANRAQTLQNTCFDPQTGQITDAALFSLYLRYQTTHTRAFHKCLNDLVKLRSERRKTENGFQAQERKNEELRLQNERHEMKKEHHEWDIHLKNAQLCHRACENVLANFKATRENPNFEAQYIAEVDRLLENDRPEFAKPAA
jgi:hypothetical protein